MTDGFINHFCPSCGNQLVYNAGKRTITCKAKCGFERKMPATEDRVSERVLAGTVKWEVIQTGYGAADHEYECDSCKASFIHDQGIRDKSCPFCGGTSLKESDASQGKIRPKGLIPFTIPASHAASALAGFLGDDLLRPGDLSSIAKPELMRGVYLPFWSVDANTKSSWIAMVKYDILDDADEKSDRNLEWIPAWGYYEKFFKGLQFPGSKHLSGKKFPGDGFKEFIKNFDPKFIVPYSVEQIEEWDVEVYQNDPNGGLVEADKFIDKDLEFDCAQKVMGSDFRELRLQTEKEPLAFYQYLFPVWIGKYSYRGTNYTYMINGVSGDVIGNKPYSVFRVALALIILVVALLVFIFGFAT